MQTYVELLQNTMVKHVGFRWNTYPRGYERVLKTDTMRGRIKDVQNWEMFPRPQRRLPGQSFLMAQMQPSFGKRYVRVYYGIGTLIPKEDWDTDQTGVLAKEIPAKGGGLAMAQMTLREQVVAEWFKNVAFATGANNTPGMSDGRPLIDTAHPISRSNSSTTWSNKPSVASDLSVASLQAGTTNLRKQKAPNNQQIINNGPSALIVAPDLQYTALQLTRADWEPRTADRNQNFLKNDRIEPVIWPYWSVQSSAGSSAGVVNGWALRGEDHSAYFLEGDDVEVESQYKLEVRSMLFICSQSFAVGADNPYGWYGSPGA